MLAVSGHIIMKNVTREIGYDFLKTQAPQNHGFTSLSCIAIKTTDYFYEF
jgi:hypothetical protein